ncbi:MAG: protein kinase [Alphaproteobacteria bacterium]|nr:protein kinase [Alphaproteobacteria bacterium]
MADDQTQQPRVAVRTEHHSALSAGARIGRYQIAAVLGQGAFGITYRARDLQLDRDVALKEYLPSSLAVRLNGVTVAPHSTQVADDFAWGRAKFLDEAKTLARLGHATAVVRVFDFLEANGTAYVVMQLLEGETLAALCRRQGLVPQAAIDRLLPPLLDGLEQIHAAGVLHRDIKPDNIIVAPDGTPTLIDFGAARAAIADRAQALTAIYTPAYAPTEQFTSGQQGPYTDVFSLAATLYSCVCGRRPLSTAKRMVGGEMPSARALGAGGYGANLLAAIDAGLLLRAEDRPQTIGEWRKVFASGEWPKLLTEGDTTLTRPRVEQATTLMGGPKGGWPKGSRPPGALGALRGRGKLAALAAIAAILLAIVGGVVLWWLEPSQGLAAELEAALAKAVPKETPEQRKSVVSSFLQASPNRALAVAPKAGRLRGTGGWPTRDLAEQRALEKCQQIYDEPCALIAVDDEVLPPGADGSWPIRDAPNVHYAGPFLVEHIPAMSAHDLQRGDVAGYGTARAPKAMAFNALGFLTVVSGAANQRAAEEAALQACKKELPAQEASLPCFLYAVESRVVLPLRATAPITPAPSPAPAPPRPENTLRARLLESLAKASPAQAETERELVAGSYLVSKFHKALAALPPSGTWATADKPSAAIAEERVLEGCQVKYGAPCLVVAVDDVVQPADAAQARRPMPRVAYDGVFDPQKIPAFDDDQRERPDIAGYRAARLPKAAAFHPLGRLFTVSGSASQRDAEEQVLAACNDDPHRTQQDGPCLLYAIGDRVVLPLGARAAITPKSMSPTDAIMRAELLQRLTRIAPAMTLAVREGQVDAFLASSPHKAIVAFPPSTSWRSFSQESALAAEEQALEGCQIYYKGPCIPVALDNSILPPDSGVGAKSMPRVAYEGVFDPQKIPAVPEAVRRRPDVVGYRAAKGPKAAAFHPWGQLFIVTDAATQRDAEQRALSDCRTDPQRHYQGIACLLYAAGDQVVLPKRSTTPIAAP